MKCSDRKRDLFSHGTRSIRRLAAAVAFAGLAGSWADAGTPISFSGGVSLATAGNYTPSGLPNDTDDVDITNTGNSGSYTDTANAVSMESLSLTETSTSVKISNSTTVATNSTLTLGNPSGFTNAYSGIANDLIYEDSTKNLTILGPNNSSGTGTLALVLASSGNIDIASSGAATISANISEMTAGTSLSIGGAGSGVVTLAGTNTFSGGLTVTSGETDTIVGDVGLGASTGSITINGGRLGIGTTPTIISATRSIYLGANPTGNNNLSTLSIKGSITVSYNGSFQNLNGSTVGDLVKQGGGTLALGGASTYSGSTFINNGVIQLTAASSLPSTTTVNLGQSASTNTGTLDLNGFNQQIAGLNSTAGTGTNTINTVTASTGTSILTLGGSGSYSYGSSLAANTGFITGNGSGSGVLAISKTGTGVQIFGGFNTYSGGTTVSAGTLYVNNTTGSGTGSGSVTVNGGTLGGSGTISGSISVPSGTLATGTPGSNATLLAPLSTAGVSLSNGAKFVATIDSDLSTGNNTTGSESILAASGAVAFGSDSGALLSVTDLGTGASSPAVGTVFTIVTSTSPVTGLFSNLGTIGTFTSAITASNGDIYSVGFNNASGVGGGDNVTLTLDSVPEPACVSIFGLGAVALMRRRRRA